MHSQIRPTMRAIIQDGYGAPERVLRLEEIPVPAIGADDVLIRMRATSVNTPDWATVTGVPYILRLGVGLRRPKLPVRGSDVSGVVEAVGQRVTDLAPGDEVFGSGPGGTFAAVRGGAGGAARQEARRTRVHRRRGVRHDRARRPGRHARRGPGTRRHARPDQRRLGRGRDHGGPDRHDARRRGHRRLRSPPRRTGPVARRAPRHRLHQARTSPRAGPASTSSSTTC